MTRRGGWSDVHRALALLAHPVSLGALALLLLNDHLLRRFWPSWLTGKLGDAAWLVVAPLALGAVLVVVREVAGRGAGRLKPRQPDQNPTFVGLKREDEGAGGGPAGLTGVGLKGEDGGAREGSAGDGLYVGAFLFTGLLFGLVKTVPGIHAAFTGLLEAGLGAPPALVRDPSDLLALPAMGIAWWLWRGEGALSFLPAILAASAWERLNGRSASSNAHPRRGEDDRPLVGGSKLPGSPRPVIAGQNHFQSNRRGPTNTGRGDPASTRGWLRGPFFSFLRSAWERLNGRSASSNAHPRQCERSHLLVEGSKLPGSPRPVIAGEALLPVDRRHYPTNTGRGDPASTRGWLRGLIAAFGLRGALEREALCAFAEPFLRSRGGTRSNVFFRIGARLLGNSHKESSLNPTKVGFWISCRDFSRPAFSLRDHINEKNALTARGVAALLLAAMLSIANAGIPDPGITCFRQEGDALIASAGYNGYRSTDGGVSWGFDPGAHFPCDYSGDEEDWVEVEPAQAEAQAATRYRYRPNQEIQTSSDGGQTWQTAYSLTPTSEAEQQYYLRRRPGNTVFRPGPLDAIRDPRSGNVLFAMGHQGVLIHHSSGDWSWGMGGEYQHISVFPTADAFSLLLGGMLPLAVGALLLVFASLALRWTAKPLRITALAFGWAAFLLITILFPPVTANGYTQVATTIGMLGGAVMILPLSLEQSFQLGRINPTALPRLILFGLAAGLLFFLPYVLWLYNALPSLFLATGFALGLTLAVLAAGIFSVRKG